jgi:tRNA A-37 threonylcarbamoyl transferase component Bud32
VQVSRQAAAQAGAAVADGERGQVKTDSPTGRRPRRAGPVDRAGRDRVLDRYVLLERIGAGAFGTVWRAHDDRLHREVAVKRIARGPRESREERRRATREAVAAARLSHPAIVALYEADADDDAYYLVSELVRGASLDRLLAAGELEDREILRIGAVLSDALAHAHARGVVHRDVKPQNVIVPDEVTGGGAQAKLTDFGVALIAGDQPLTRAGDVVGTFAYMAPEQAQGRVVDARADLYSLALTIYEGLAGFNPMRGSTPALTAVLQRDPVKPLERTRPDLPRGLCQSLDRALSVDPTRRGSLADLRLALGRALSAPLPARRRRRPPPARQAPAIRLGPRRPRPLAGLAAAALVLAALATPLGPAAPVSALWAAAAAGAAVALLPRGGWLAFALAGVVWLAVSGQPGTALLVALAAAPVPLLLRGAPWLWSAPALAPVLGALGLAVSFPAVAGRCGAAWQRAALGALGIWWLALAEPLYDTRLLFGAAAGTRPRATWQGSAPDAISHALAPLISGRCLALAAVWALAAVALPWVVRGRSPMARALGAIGWAMGLVAASGLLGAQAGGPGAGTLVIGAAAAVVVATVSLPAGVGASTHPGVP